MKKKTPLPHISLFLTKIIPPLSGQISDKTLYTWYHLALTIYPDGHSQNQITHTTITQTYIYFPPCSSLICLLSLDSFPLFISFYILH